MTWSEITEQQLAVNKKAGNIKDIKNFKYRGALEFMQFGKLAAPAVGDEVSYLLGCIRDAPGPFFEFWRHVIM
jgi:hypothetical protein